MGIAARLFPLLPDPLRDLAVTLFSILIDRRRFGPAYRTALGSITDPGFPAARERLVVARMAALLGRPISSLEDCGHDTKDTIRRRVLELGNAGSLAGTLEWSTGGTTGNPVDVPVTPSEDALNTALTRSFILNELMNLSDPRRTAYFTGKVLMPPGRNHPPFWVRDLRGRRRYYSMFHVLPANIPAFADDLDRFRPNLLIANPSPLARLARLLAAAGWTPRKPPLGIWSMAEELLPADREAIEATFKCRVTNTYGMTEMAILAADCVHGNMHVCEAYGRTETVPAAGGRLELVGTSFVRERVPVVRFRTGDLCDALERIDCPCGRKGLVIRGLSGRAVEVVTLPDGRTLTASPLADVLRRVPGLVWSRFEVLSVDRWRLRYHSATRQDEAVLAEVRRELERRAAGVTLEAAWDPSPVPAGPKDRLIVFISPGDHET